MISKMPKAGKKGTYPHLAIRPYPEQYVAKDWGVAEVTATTLRENNRMIGIFSKRHFKIGHDPDDDTVTARRKQ